MEWDPQSAPREQAKEMSNPRLVFWNLSQFTGVHILWTYCAKPQSYHALAPSVSLVISQLTHTPKNRPETLHTQGRARPAEFPLLNTISPLFTQTLQVLTKTTFRSRDLKEALPSDTHYAPLVPPDGTGAGAVL